MLLACAWAAAAEPLFDGPLPAQPVLIPVPVTVEHGSESQWLLDTGSSVLALDAAQMPGLTPISGAQVQSGVSGNTLDTTRYSLRGVRLGGHGLHDAQALGASMRMLSALLGSEFTGIAGMPLLRGRVLELDYDRQRLCLWESVPPHCADFTSVPLTAGKLPLLRADIGGIQGEWLVDTGSDDTVTAGTALFDRMLAGGFILLNERSGGQAGVDGMAKVRQGWFLKGELLGVPLRGREISEDHGQASLGLGFWHALHTAVDFKSARLLYKPRHAPAAPVCVQHMLSAVLLYNARGAQVARLKPGPGALRDAGFAEEDRITEINGLRVPQLNLQSLAALCARHAGARLQVRMIPAGADKPEQREVALPPFISLWDFPGLDEERRKRLPDAR